MRRGLSLWRDEEPGGRRSSTQSFDPDGLERKSQEILDQTFDLEEEQKEILLLPKRGEPLPPTPLSPFSLLRSRLSQLGDLYAVEVGELLGEIYRADEVDVLYAFLKEACAKEGFEPPRQIFQRFLFECKMKEEQAQIMTDPIFPSQGEKSVELKRGLTEHLLKKIPQDQKEAERAKMEEKAERICQRVGENCRERIEEIKRKIQERRRNKNRIFGEVKVEVQGQRERVRIGFEGAFHLLHYSHYLKFKRLFFLHSVLLMRERKEGGEREEEKERRGKEKGEEEEEEEKEDSERKEEEEEDEEEEEVRYQGRMRSEREMEASNKGIVVEFATKKEHQKIILTPEEEKGFHARLFVLIQRYHCLGRNDSAWGGSGFHAALTEHVFDFLKREETNVTMECFASPFNCHFRNFCSVFEDTDRYFGSLGSFFDLEVYQGSFEWNPPYLEDLMEEGVNRLFSFLSSGEEAKKEEGDDSAMISGGEEKGEGEKGQERGALSFFIVLPDWLVPPTPSIEMLRSPTFAPYRKADVHQPKGKDNWLDGFQHDGRPRHFIAPWDGRFFFVQNTKGSEKWPITTRLIEDLLDVFKTGASPSNERSYGRSSDRESWSDSTKSHDHRDDRKRKPIFDRVDFSKRRR